jgi:hypothetical protein
MFERCHAALPGLVAVLVFAFTAAGAEASDGDGSASFRSASKANAERDAHGRSAHRHRRISSQPRARKPERLPSNPPAPLEPPVPPASGSVVPGTGAVLAQDLVDVANPCLTWGRISDPYLEGCDSSGERDPFIVRRSGDGDPHLAVGASSPSRYYRRYISRAGVQSIYDADAGNPSTRTQTQRWSTRGNPWSFGPGTYAFYLSFRLQELPDGSSPFPNAQSRGGGNSKFSQLIQWKALGEGVRENKVAFSATIGSDGIKFIARDGAENLARILEVPTGEWIRMAVVTNWGSEGWYEVWADLDGNGSMTRVLDRQTGIDFTEGRIHGAMGIGPYHHLSLFDGSVPGQPRQEMVYTDYANVQITEWLGR